MTTITRRAVIAGAPAAAAGALAAGTAVNVAAVSMTRATEVDPIFAAIERERAAYAAYLVTGADQHQVSDQNPFPMPKGKLEDRRAEKKRLASSEHKAWWARCEEVEKAHEQSAQTLWSAREALLQTQPISVGGLIAFIDHIEGPFSSGSAGEAFWDDKERELAFQTLAAAARHLIGGGAA